MPRAGRLARVGALLVLRVLEGPGNPEPIADALWWHRQDDTAHAWLRRLIVETARRL
jgi:hypothetical protein